MSWESKIDACKYLDLIHFNLTFFWAAKVVCGGENGEMSCKYDPLWLWAKYLCRGGTQCSKSLKLELIIRKLWRWLLQTQILLHSTLLYSRFNILFRVLPAALVETVPHIYKSVIFSPVIPSYMKTVANVEVVLEVCCLWDFFRCSIREVAMDVGPRATKHVFLFVCLLS